MLRRPNGVPHPALRPGLRVDRVGTEAVVLDGRAGVVHRLTGDAAEVLTELVMRGRDVADLPARLADAVAGLREVGVLRPGIGRRRVLGTATVGALGIMSLALPSALVAASPGSTRVRGTATDVSTDGSLGPPAGASASDGFTYRTYDTPLGGGEYFSVGGSGYLVVDVLVVGAGGAGGTGGTGYGGGGGGGAVSLLLERQVSAGNLTVLVGEGGYGSISPAGEGSSVYDPGIGGYLISASGGAGGQGSAGAGGKSYAGVTSPGGNGGAGSGSFGGGGAGAGGAGSAPVSNDGGDGGPAYPVTGFFASAYSVAGGGGGAGYDAGGTAGTGGGDGGGTYGAAARNASGPGGGGGGPVGSWATPGSGGDGLVVFRYLT